MSIRIKYEVKRSAKRNKFVLNAYEALVENGPKRPQVEIFVYNEFEVTFAIPCDFFIYFWSLQSIATSIQQINVNNVC